MQRARNNLPILIPIENGREDRMYVGACANEEKNDEQEALEVKEGRLFDDDIR